MNFEVPEEYRNFVSSAQEVLEQFNYISESDRLVYRIFDLGLGGEKGADSGDWKGALARYADLFETVSRFMDQAMRDYLWFREIPVLRVMIHPSAQLCGRRSVYLEGSLRVGDYVDDEWFLVKILLELSVKVPSIGLSIIDSDGQFLLIEGADHIPAWLDPECATNRVWVIGGEVTIVPLSAPGLLPNNGIHLNNALDYLATQIGSVPTEHKNDLRALQVCIGAKIKKLSPAYVQASHHNSVCFLPAKVVKLFDCIQGVIGTIVDELGKPNMARKGNNHGKYGNDGKAPPPQVNFWNLLLPDGQIETDARCVAVVFTRAQFAKMIFKPFRAPALLQQYQKRAYSALMQSCGNKPEMKKLAQKNAEVSCRIIVGIAILLKKHFDGDHDSDSSRKGRPGTIEAFLQGHFEKVGDQEAKQKHILRGEKVMERQFIIEAMTIDGTYDLDAEDAMLSEGGPGEKGVPYRDSFEREMRKKVATELEKILSGSTTLKFGGVNKSLQTSDDDSWLTLSEEAFDEEMRRRTKLFQTNNPESESDADAEKDGITNNAPARDNEANMQEMDKIVSGMKDLLDDEEDEVSDADGGDSDSGTQEPDPVRKERGDLAANASMLDAEEDVDTPLHVNVDKVLAIMNKYSAGSLSREKRDQTDTGGDGESDEQGKEKLDKTEEGISDGFTYEEYSEAMDQELFGTAMAETFERTKGSRDDPIGTVDIEKNLLKNLMEAEAVVPGSHTPVAAMLAMINAKMPSVGVNSDDEDEEEDED